MSAVSDHVKPRPAAKVRLKWDAVRDKPLLLFPEGVLVLNPAAYEILQLCDGSRNVAEISQALGEKFNNPAVDADVRALLARLSERGLMVLGE
jgi:pyrroloquinoline quinone biosynthesis protein D